MSYTIAFCGDVAGETHMLFAALCQSAHMRRSVTRGSVAQRCTQNQRIILVMPKLRGAAHQPKDFLWSCQALSDSTWRRGPAGKNRAYGNYQVLVATRSQQRGEGFSNTGFIDRENDAAPRGSTLVWASCSAPVVVPRTPSSDSLSGFCWKLAAYATVVAAVPLTTVVVVVVVRVAPVARRVVVKWP